MYTCHKELAYNFKKAFIIHTPKKREDLLLLGLFLHLVVHLAKWEKWSLGLERNSPSTDDLSESEPFTT